MTNALTLLVFSACLGACAPGIPEIPPPASSVTRREALAASRAYTSMIWRGSLRNVRHGTDGDGIRTDTPDASAAGYDAGAWWKPGMRSIGMPYKWGGFDTPRQFSERLKADAANGGLPAAAGDMGTPEKQAAGDAAVSRFAAGVDCSGFGLPLLAAGQALFHTGTPRPLHAASLLGRPPDGRHPDCAGAPCAPVHSVGGNGKEQVPGQ